MPSVEVITKVLHDYIDAWNRVDKDAVIALYAPEAIWYDPVGQPPHVGHEGIGEFFEASRKQAEKLELVVKDLLVCGDEAVMQFEINASIGDSVIVIDVIETFEFDDSDHITQAKAYWDMSRARARGA